MSTGSGPRDASRTKPELIAAVIDEVRAYHRSIDVLDDLVAEHVGVNRTDRRCLGLLHHRGRMTAGELAREACLSTGATTTAIDRLEERGFVRRVPDPEDRRKVLVEATEESVESCSRLYGQLNERGTAALDKLSARDLETVLGFVQVARMLTEEHGERLRSQLQRHDEAPGDP